MSKNLFIRDIARRFDINESVDYFAGWFFITKKKVQTTQAPKE